MGAVAGQHADGQLNGREPCQQDGGTARVVASHGLEHPQPVSEIQRIKRGRKIRYAQTKEVIEGALTDQRGEVIVAGERRSGRLG